MAASTTIANYRICRDPLARAEIRKGQDRRQAFA
jgi:hypothetical protein